MKSDTSEPKHAGKVVKSPYHGAAEVEFTYHGELRRILIDQPQGYFKQQALIGKHVQFDIVQDSVFVHEIGFAAIKP